MKQSLWLSTMIARTSLISSKNNASSAQLREREERAQENRKTWMLKWTLPPSNVIWTGSTTTVGGSATYFTMVVPNCDHRPGHSVDVFWLTHQSSQQETISKFLLMQPPSIYIPGEQEMATDSFSGHSGSTLLS